MVLRDSDQMQSIGVANIPNAYHRSCSKRLLEYNVMLVGESGCGRSTLIQTLFMTQVAGGMSGSVDQINDQLKGMAVIDEAVPYEPLRKVLLSSDVSSGNLLEKIKEEAILDAESNTRVEEYRVEFEERAFRTRLTITDIKGFGNAIHHERASQVILDYIDSRFEEHLDNEYASGEDRRIHACLYLIPATRSTNRLMPLDLITMRKLGERVNLIPVITKAEILTVAEKIQMKKMIMNELTKLKIQTYQLPSLDTLQDEEQQERYCQIRDAMPFAIIGATHDLASPEGRRVRGRAYPWGRTEYDDETQSDLPLLRCLLIRTHLYDLLQTTHKYYYERHRQRQLIKRLISRPFSQLAASVTLPTEKSLEVQQEAAMRQLYIQHQKELQADAARLEQMEMEYSSAIQERENEVDDLKQRVQAGIKCETRYESAY